MSLRPVNWSVAGPGLRTSIEATRTVELGDPDAWRAPFNAFAQLGHSVWRSPRSSAGRAAPSTDLLAMVDEAAAALVPGPLATTALATLVVDDPRGAGGAGRRRAQRRRRVRVRYHRRGRHRDGNRPVRARCGPGRGLRAARLDGWLLIDGTADGVTIEPLEATDFSRPLARVTLASRPRPALHRVAAAGDAI